VLLIDNDKQGNASKFFGAYDYDKPSIADVLTGRDVDLSKVIRQTKFENLDVLPANLSLLRADKEVLLDTARAQQTRLKKALENLGGLYDYVIIDNAPDLNISNINAIVASDDILIPIKIDQFALDGLEILTEQAEDLRSFNPRLKIAGGFVTMYQKNNVNTAGLKYLREKQTLIPMFDAVISKTVKVDESTFKGEPLLKYAPKTRAASDYCALAEEYLGRSSGG